MKLQPVRSNGRNSKELVSGKPSAVPTGVTRASLVAIAFYALATARAETPPAESKPERGSVFIGFGTELGAFHHELLYSGHVGLHFGAHWGPSFALTVAYGQAHPFGSRFAQNEASLVLSGGYRFGLQRGPWRLFVGPELGAGFLGYSEVPTPFVEVGPYFGIAMEIYPRFFLGLEGHLPVRFSGSGDPQDPIPIPSVSFQPGGWLGFTWAI